MLKEKSQWDRPLPAGSGRGIAIHESVGSVVGQVGKLTVVDGVVQESNFDRYRILRISETPSIETYFSLSGGEMWGGIGEAAVGTLAPAVTNAIFRATGKRVRSLPIADHDLSWG